MTALTWVVLAGCAVAGLWALVRVLRDREIAFGLLVCLGVVELAAVVLAAVVLVGLATGRDVTEPVVLVGYLLFAVALLPGAALWALVERSRWGSAVVLAGAATLAVVVVRMEQLWSVTS